MGCLVIRASLLVFAAAEKKRARRFLAPRRPPVIRVAGMRKDVWERRVKQCLRSAAEPLPTAAFAGACGGRVAVARNASLTRVPPARRGASVAAVDASTFSVAGALLVSG